MNTKIFNLIKQNLEQAFNLPKYKDIVITPNKASSTDDPKIQFSGANTSTNTDIYLRVYPESNGTLSFEGSSGQLFSITNNLSSGSICLKRK